jgi:hypothetical protein
LLWSKPKIYQQTLIVSEHRLAGFNKKRVEVTVIIQVSMISALTCMSLPYDLKTSVPKLLN